MSLSTVIPAKNEERRIGPTLQEYGQFFERAEGNAEIIVIINQTTDNTASVVQQFQHQFPFIRLIESHEFGKGRAVAHGFKEARGDYIGFIDADSATSAREFSRLYQHLVDHPDVEGVIASRYLPGAKVIPPQPFTRRLWSRAFNLAVRALFGLKYTDTQCGCKIFKAEVAKTLAENLIVDHWTFDVNMLLTARQRGYQIAELPTMWEAKPGSTLKVGSALWNVPSELVQLKRHVLEFNQDAQR